MKISALLFTTTHRKIAKVRGSCFLRSNEVSSLFGVNQDGRCSAAFGHKELWYPAPWVHEVELTMVLNLCWVVLRGKSG